MNTEKPNERLAGVAAAAGAYLLWGILPVYWKQINTVPAFEILSHRMAWSFVFMVLILLVTGKAGAFLGELREILSRHKKLLGVFLAAFLISINWLLYIWAVNNNHIVQTSLGYYINPLVSVLLGIIVLKEKLSLWQILSFLLALIGVLNMTLNAGAFPWIALVLAFSFGIYGLFKKMINIGAVTGITLETLIVSPFALIYLNHIHSSGSGAFGLNSPDVSWFLAGAGIVTATPLILFASGARRLPLSVVGFLQYIAPTIALFIGVFLYNEPFTSVHLVSFLCIWIALTIFSLSRTKSFIQIEAIIKNKMPAFEKSQG